MKRGNKEKFLLGIILLASLLVRAWGVDYDLPYIYNPDEPAYITISQNIFKTGDVNPHFFNYPSLFFYINALAYIPYFLLGNVLGVIHSPGDILPPISLAMGVTQAQMPTAVLWGRIITICFGVGTVGLAYLAGRQLSGRPAVGAITSLMLAVSPTNIGYSRLITPDTFVTFFVLASFLASILVYQQGKTWNYVAAGICAGLAASCKYTGGVVVLPLILAHFLRCGREAFKQRNLYLALFLCGAGFFATTPFALLDSHKFLDDLRFEIQHYGTGHPGMEGNSLAWYLNYMWTTGGVLYLLAVPGFVYSAVSRPQETSLRLIFPLAYFAVLCSFVVRNDRTFLPLTPFLFLSAALFLIFLYDKLRAMKKESLRRLSPALLAGLTAAALAIPIVKTADDVRRLTTVDSRETARIWIADTLPRGAKIAIESYSPFVDPQRFTVQGFWSMIGKDPEWYAENGFEYLVFSQGMYGRFYLEPERYGSEVKQYDGFFTRLTLVKMFVDGGYEIRIYTVE
jgi:4-amino-4-deoxy-L-arabinose transferase-like glycosyltransferase